MITASTASESPSFARILATVTSFSARSTFSIFIASTMASGSPAFWGLMREPATADPARIAESIARTEQRLDMLEAHLAKGRSYLGGERFGMAEIAVGPSVHRWLNMPVERAPRPHLQRWYETIAGREAAGPALPLPIK